MMKRIGFTIMALAMLIVCSCSKGLPQVIELPRYDYRSTTLLEIARIEKTDTATVFSFKAFFESYPWMAISADSYLYSEGIKYKLMSADGITLGEKVKRTPEGEIDFKLFFEPVPSNLREVNFMEGESKGDFKIYHIDLTGNKKAKEKVAAEMPAHLPDPSTDSGLTTVEVDLGCSLKGLPQVDIKLLNSPLIPPRKKGNFEADATFDDSGKASVQFYQNGVYESFLMFDNISYVCGQDFFTDPGETVKITLDASYRYLTDIRFGLRSSNETLLFYPRFEGRYSFLLDYLDYLSEPNAYNLLVDSRLADDIQDFDGYANLVSSLYRDYIDTLSSDKTIPDVVKEYLQIKLKGQAALAMTDGDMVRRSAYYMATGNIPNDFPPLGLQDKDYSWLGSIDMNDPRIVLSGDLSRILRPEVIKAVAPDGKGFIGALATLSPLTSRAKAGESLSAEELDLFDKCEYPMFKKCLERIAFEADESAAQEEALLDPLDKAPATGAAGKIRSVPDVPSEDMLDAILARYKGKAVLVDFWATWCAPCKAAIKTMEPLKGSRFKDISFVYITSTTSPKEEWLKMVPNIHGDHYYLTDGQLGVIYNQLKTNAYPSYVIVRKDGTKSETIIGSHGDELLSSLDDAARQTVSD